MNLEKKFFKNIADTQDASTSYNQLAEELFYAGAVEQAFNCGGFNVDRSTDRYQLDAETFGNVMFWLAQTPEALQRVEEVLMAARKQMSFMEEEGNLKDLEREEQEADQKVLEQEVQNQNWLLLAG